MPVDVRPAEPGEVVFTVIAGEGKETASPPAHEGDMVVRDRCPVTGNEALWSQRRSLRSAMRGRSGPPMPQAGEPIGRAGSR
jgi:hypothetical protein